MSTVMRDKHQYALSLSSLPLGLRWGSWQHLQLRPFVLLRYLERRENTDLWASQKPREAQGEDLDFMAP